MNYIKKEIKFASNDITLEFNKYSKQANSSVMVTSGGTQVLVTVCVDYKNSGKNNFFPLTVDYIEKFYASGRIPGGFIKRETKPGNSEILIARSLDRPLRPCFPKEFNAETQIVATVLSYDDQNDPASLSLIGASSCLMISDIPFDGPLCYLNLGYLEDKYILNPSSDLNLDLNLTIAAKPQGVVMVEANANFISEEKILECIEYAHKEMKPVFEAQLELKEEFGKDKIDLKEFSNSAQVLDKSEFSDFILDDLKDAYKILNKSDRNLAIAKIRKKITKHFNRDEDHKIDIEIDNLFDEIKSDLIRNKIFDENIRLDGRKFDDIRNISCETSVLKRPHGSGLFTRGETQSLAVVTLGSEMDQQEIDSMTVKNYSKNFFLHYNFPPFSVGEVKGLRAPSRREIGHGALAEKALTPVIPSNDEFNYTIRLVSEILESNGSSSMATVCASTLALLDAGVPIKDHIAGVAMGLVAKKDNKNIILSDITGDEDHIGDMDFKVCGSESGISALQMDIKISNISKELFEKALSMAKTGRIKILDIMRTSIRKPREISKYAPKKYKIEINKKKIKDLIGPNGKNIKKIVSDSGVKIDINDDGQVILFSKSEIDIKKAKQMIYDLVSDPEIGKNYKGTVKNILEFGAFIEIKPGCEGLCHISNIDNKRIQKVEDVLKVGEKVTVKIIGIDKFGRIKLSRKAVYDENNKSD